MESATINANLADCIRASKSIGGDTFYNVCTGSSTWVPWGSADWFWTVAGVVAVLLLLCGGVLLTAILMHSPEKRT